LSEKPEVVVLHTVPTALEIDELTLPPAVQEKLDEGREVKASYLFEMVVARVLIRCTMTLSLHEEDA
jgi:hypothetical protein